MSTKNKGFTLVEVLISTVVIGIISMVLIPATKALMEARSQQYAQEQNMISSKIVNVLQTYADLRDDAPGRLPAPNYLGGGPVPYTVVNKSTNMDLWEDIIMSGIAPNKINFDGTPAQNVRAYQLLPDQTESISFFKNTDEPSVTIEYDYGVVYMSGCNQYDNSCPTRGLLTGLSDVNGTWQDAGQDLDPYFVSTKTLQINKLRDLNKKLYILRNYIIQEYQTRQKSADQSDLTLTHRINGDATDDDGDGLYDYYKDSTFENFAEGTDNCWYNDDEGPKASSGTAWYKLSEDTEILEGVGLNPEIFSKTPWKGVIEYCPFYMLEKIDQEHPNHAGEHKHTSYAAIRVADDLLTDGNSASGNSHVYLTF